jgi:hypothetical protein
LNDLLTYLFVDNFFNIPLSDKVVRTELGNEDCLVIEERLSSTVHVRECSIGNLAPLTLFAERGVFSGHVYQPRVNHRELNFSSYHRGDDIKGSDPMMKSMLIVKPETHFSCGNKISLFLYEVKEVNLSEEGMVLETPAPLWFDYIVGNDTKNAAEIVPDDALDNAVAALQKNRKRRFFGTGHIKQYRACKLSVATFERALQLFGLRRNEYYRSYSTVQVEEACSFIRFISEISLGNNENVNAFLEKYGLTHIYQDGTKEPQRVLQELSMIVRSLVPLRVAAYDGRHRFALCCYCATGYFHPTNALEMESVSFKELVGNCSYRGEGVLDLKFEDCEVFKQQRIKVAVSQENVSFEDICLDLAALGRITTASQMQNVEITWCSLCSEAIEFIMNSQEFKRMKPLNFESYWADPAVDVYSALLTPLKKYFQGLDITRKGVAVGNIKNDLVQVLQKLEFKRFTYPLGYKRIAKPPNGCPKDLATFATVVKFLSHDPVNFNGIRMYFQLDSWNVPQAPLTDLDKAIFKGLPYFRYFVLWPVSEVTLHCEKKYIMEKKSFKFAATVRVVRDWYQIWSAFQNLRTSGRNTI